jgi:hypothetical protein
MRSVNDGHDGAQLFERATMPVDLGLTAEFCQVSLPMFSANGRLSAVRAHRMDEGWRRRVGAVAIYRIDRADDNRQTGNPDESIGHSL